MNSRSRSKSIPSGRAMTCEVAASCDLVGNRNEATILIGGERCMALVDTGPMVTTVSQQLYESKLLNRYPLQALDALQVEGAGGQVVSHLGFIEVNMTSEGDEVWVPTLVVTSNDFSMRVPVILGTNILKVMQTWTNPISLTR